MPSIAVGNYFLQRLLPTNQRIIIIIIITKSLQDENIKRYENPYLIANIGNTSIIIIGDTFISIIGNVTITGDTFLYIIEYTSIYKT